VVDCSVTGLDLKLVSALCVCSRGRDYSLAVLSCIFIVSYFFALVKKKHWHYFSILLMREGASWGNAPKGDILPWTSASVPVHQELMSYANRETISFLHAVLTWLGDAGKPRKKCK